MSRKQNQDHLGNPVRVLKRKDMDVVSSAFGIRFVPGGSNGLVEFYVEDDENYHYKMAFDWAWMLDFVDVAWRAKAAYKTAAKHFKGAC